MTGTSGAFNRKVSSGGAGLPAPVIRLSISTTGLEVLVAKNNPNTNGVSTMTPVNLASVSVHGLPESIMSDLAGYKPQLELLRYVGTRTKSTSILSRNFRSSGYVHPVNGPAPSGNGHHTHGGIQPFVIGAERQTEWSVTNWGQVIDVTKGAYAFMQFGVVPYRTAFNTLAFDAFAMSASGTNNNRGMGKRFPYWGKYKPGYFAFRWSIIDKSDERGQRITGPMSNVISLTNEIFPFNPANTDQGQATATIAPRYNALRGQFFVGSVSRLPR